MFPRANNSVLSCTAILAIFLSSSALTLGQQIYVETPFTGVSDSFYENMGVNFGFSLPGGQGPGSRVTGFGPFGNVVFSQGGSQSAIPPFGGYDPNASGRFGFNYLNGNGGGFSLGLELGSGSNRTLQSTTPGVMVQNGFGGSIFDGSFRPFVTGIIPVVSDGPPMMDNGVIRALNSGQLDLSNLGEGTQPTYSTTSEYTRESTAQLAMASVDEIKSRKAKAQSSKKTAVDGLIRQVFDAEESGDYMEARSLLRKAIRECEDPVKKKLLRKKLTSLRGK